MPRYVHTHNIFAILTYQDSISGVEHTFHIICERIVYLKKSCQLTPRWTMRQVEEKESSFEYQDGSIFLAVLDYQGSNAETELIVFQSKTREKVEIF